MDYEKAKKVVQSTKSRENFILVKLDYETQLVLPHKAGLAFVGAIAEAEMLHTPYSKPHRIQGLEREKFQVTTLSCEDYERYKIAALLNITVDDVKLIEEGSVTSTV